MKVCLRKLYAYVVGMLFLIATTSNMVGQWQVQGHTKAFNLSAVAFVNADSGYACGENYIIKTTNGGKTWYERGFKYKICDISFPSFDTGYAVGEIVYKTTNAGVTWDSIFHHVVVEPGRINTRFVAFSDTQNGMIVGDHEASYFTRDGGRTWQYDPWHWGDGYVCAFSMPSANVAYKSMRAYGCFLFVDRMSVQHKTTSGGRLWIRNESWSLGRFAFFRPKPSALFFLDEFNGWYAETGDEPGYRMQPNLRDSLLFKTTNGGEEWTLLGVPIDGYVHAFAFVDVNNGYAAVSKGTVYSTTDGGNTWLTEYIHSQPVALNDICVVDKSVVYAVGDRGLILKKVLPVSVNDASVSQPVTLYPNPTTSNVHIANLKPGATIEVVGILGTLRRIERTNSPWFSVLLSDLPAGTYLVIVMSDNQRRTFVVQKL